MASKLIKKSLRLKLTKNIGEVSALFYSPQKAEGIMTFAHGAGAGMNNKFMEEASLKMAGEGIATLRFNFPYMEKGKKIPDSKSVCSIAIKAAVEKAAILCPKLPVFSSGKSFGGRMTSTAASDGLLEEINGIIFFGFPLHAPGKPSNDRAEHLYKVTKPMLFLQGSRDALASLDLLKPVCKKLGRKAKLFVIKDADHSFHVPKSSGLKDADVIDLLCKEIKNWISAL